MKKIFCFFILFSISIIQVFSQNIVITKAQEKGLPISIRITEGSKWLQKTNIGTRKPQMSIWLEDVNGNYQEALFITLLYGKQLINPTKTKLDIVLLRKALPFWLGRQYTKNREYPTYDNPIPDAITKATPSGSFTLDTIITSDIKKGYIYLEINTLADVNQHYDEYQGQPSLIYKGFVDFEKKGRYKLDLTYIGDSTKDGVGLTNMSNVTTAKDIVMNVVVTVD